MEGKKRSSKRRLKLSDRKLKNMPSIDRLGALPDALICHILSFIPTRRTVRTSILARRWRFLWTHVPTLDFNYLGHFNIPTRSSDIINRVMLLHKVQSINTFRIPSMDYIREYELNTWITTAISRNVQNLDICCLRYEEPVTLTQCVFTCKTLVNLSLVFCGIPSSGAISLPSLKELNLKKILCEVAEALPRLLSGCPVLEVLIIDHVLFVDEVVGCCLNISSPTIKRLVLHTPWECDMFPESCKLVEINAPALVYLQVDRCPLEFHSILPIHSLTEAHIDLDISTLVNYTTCSVVKFIYHLHDVKCLELTGYTNEEFYYSARLRDQVPDLAVAGSIPKFGNLTKLKLRMNVNWDFVMRLLASADNLEVLNFGVGLANWVEPEQVPTCLLSRVKTININDIECTEHEYCMVKYLLRNAQVLERMDIRFSIRNCVDKKTKSDTRKRISKFERGSKTCKVVIR